MLHGVIIKDGLYCTMLVGESVFLEFVLHSNCQDPDFELGGLSCYVCSIGGVHDPLKDHLIEMMLSKPYTVCSVHQFFA